MRLSRVAQLAATFCWGFISKPATAVERNPCALFRYDDFGCNETVQCQADWPSETFDYKPRFVDPSLAGSLLLNWYPITELADGEEKDGKDDKVCSSNVAHNPHGRASLIWAQQKKSRKKRDDNDFSHVSHPHQRREDECCRPTWDCYYFLSTVEVVLRYDGLSRIKHLEDWQKAICCIADYLGSCDHPDEKVPIRWQQPPSCSYKVWTDDDQYEAEKGTQGIE